MKVWKTSQDLIKVYVIRYTSLINVFFTCLKRNAVLFQLAKEMECADLPESMREHMMIFLTQKESRYLRLKRQKMNKDMFEVVKHIGFGAFGRVSLVKKVPKLILSFFDCFSYFKML